MTSCLKHNIEFEEELCDEDDEVCQALLDNQRFLLDMFNWTGDGDMEWDIGFDKDEDWNSYGDIVVDYLPEGFEEWTDDEKDEWLSFDKNDEEMALAWFDDWVDPLLDPLTGEFIYLSDPNFDLETEWEIVNCEAMFDFGSDYVDYIDDLANIDVGYDDYNDFLDVDEVSGM